MVKLIGRELLLAWRSPADCLNPLVFYLIVIAFFPLAISPEPALLRQLAPGVLWIAALLATLLSLPRFLADDFQDGSYSLVLLSTQPLSLIAFTKVLAHWLLIGVPLVVLAPCAAMMLSLPMHAIGILVAALALGTPVLSFVGAIGASLTVGLRQGNLLAAILVLPLQIPVLIFGASAVTSAVNGMPVSGQLAILAMFLALALTLAPFAIAGAWRVAASGV